MKVEDGMRLTGHLRIYKNDILVVDQKNTIDNELLAKLSDTLNSNADFAFDAMFTTDEEYFGSGGSDNKDGIMYLVTARYQTTVTIVHASDPSGSYYRQWTGTLTASGAIAVTGAGIGHNLVADSTAIATAFTTAFAYTTFSTINLVSTDVLKIHWKLSFS